MASSIDYASSALQDPQLDARFEAALTAARDLTDPVEHLVGGRLRSDGDVIELADPTGHPAVTRRTYRGGAAMVDHALSAARTAASAWRALPYQERCELMREAREGLLANQAELAGLNSAETGKPRLASLAESAEAGDLVAYYADQMEANGGYVVELDSTPSEQRTTQLRPYGVFGVISPFNFPVALAVNMSSAALIAGNTIIVKPSDKTPRTTTTALRHIADVLPAGVVNIVQGGSETGRALGQSSVDGIAFTGSSEVGLGLLATMQSGPYPRPVLAEMGGQNPAIVTANADLDRAAAGVARSAFGMSGQVCSACRRVIVSASVADAFVDRLREHAEELEVGDPLTAGSNLGPVIDAGITARIEAALTTAAQDGTIVTGGRIDRDGYFFAPTIVTGLPRGHELTRTELFAPFVTVTAVDDFDAAIDEANAVNHGLSAGIFSRDDAEIAEFMDRIEAGVIYANRADGATTGAWPGRQTFGGWKRSGSNGKNGFGPWYMPSFMREQSRTIVPL